MLLSKVFLYSFFTVFIVIIVNDLIICLDFSYECIMFKAQYIAGIGFGVCDYYSIIFHPEDHPALAQPQSRSVHLKCMLHLLLIQPLTNI